MTINIVVPTLGESVSEATVAKWLKAAGDTVQRDEALLELETDKVTLEVYASTAGKLSEIRAPAGTTVEGGGVLGVIAGGAGGTAPAANASATPAPAAPAQAPAATLAAKAPAVGEVLAPSVRKIVREAHLGVGGATGSGKDGRLTKADAQALAEIARETRKAASTPTPAATPA